VDDDDGDLTQQRGTLEPLVVRRARREVHHGARRRLIVSTNRALGEADEAHEEDEAQNRRRPREAARRGRRGRRERERDIRPRPAEVHERGERELGRLGEGVGRRRDRGWWGLGLGHL